MQALSYNSANIRAMKRFFDANHAIQLSNDVSMLVEALVHSVQDADRYPWDETVETMEETIRRHMFTDILKASNPTALILWNTCFLLIKTLEASPYDPGIWTRAFKPFNDLSQRLNIDASDEFIRSNENSDGTVSTQAPE